LELENWIDFWNHQLLHWGALTNDLKKKYGAREPLLDE
jgi:hypothetical protein